MGFRQCSVDREGQKYYHAALMSARVIIDSLEFALSGKELRGDVPIGMLDRLSGELFDRGGNLQYVLYGQTDQRQRPRLRLEVRGEVLLQCQRCLGSLPCPIELVTQLLLLDEKTSDVDAGVEDLDAIPVNPELDVWLLVEDEVLLAQPIAPRHVEGQCEAAGKLKDDAASPFAALAGLKDKQLN